MVSNQQRVETKSKFHDKNPFETGAANPIWALQILFRIGVAALCLSFAATNIQFGQVDPLVDLALRDDTIQEKDLVTVSQILGWLLFGLGVVTLIRPIHVVISAIFLYTILNALCTFVIGQSEPQFLMLALQATSFALPIGLFVLDFWPPKIRATLTHTLIVMGLLRVAIATTLFAFAILICKSESFAPSLPSQIQHFSEQVLRRELSTVQAETLLIFVGGVSVFFARPFLSGFHWIDGLISTIWCLAIVSAPFLAKGFVAYPEILQKTPLLISSLGVTLFYALCVRHRDPEYLFENEI